MTVARAIHIVRAPRVWRQTSPDGDAAVVGPVIDRLGRPLRELRLSVIDRCNFRCVYCMPRSVFPRNHAFMAKDRLLELDAIARAAEVFVALGVHKLRLTGGEPLLRPRLELLIEQLAELRTPDGDPVDVAMTTNGSLLAHKAAGLRRAGLGRLTVSLDAVSDEVFRRMSDVDYPVAKVFAGIDAALQAGFGHIKVNTVVKRGVNDHEIVPLARHMREHYGPAVSLRFIEYMDVGASNRWKLDEVLPSSQVISRLQEHFEMERIVSEPGTTAQRWRYIDGRGEIGTVSSVTAPFCGDCSRARLSSDGALYTCLFSSQGTDLRRWLVDGDDADDPAHHAAGLRQAIGAAWRSRADRYSEMRTNDALQEAAHTGGGTGDRRVEMHYIGG